MVHCLFGAGHLSRHHAGDVLRNTKRYTRSMAAAKPESRFLSNL
jgi:hypothetical protein